MQQIRILNSKEKKELNSKLEKQFGTKLPDYHIFINPKNRLFIIGKDYSEIDVSKLRVNSLGLYFGEVFENQIRLSIEGSQIVGETAEKNVLDIDDAQAEAWMRGEDFDLNSELEGFVIVRHNKDILGCGKISAIRLYNYVPKERRVSASFSDKDDEDE